MRGKEGGHWEGKRRIEKEEEEEEEEEEEGPCHNSNSRHVPPVRPPPPPHRGLHTFCCLPTPAAPQVSGARLH
ncbi:hypothetical protein E2C01_085845 [Portunus trituberculatus]|uniref:Uncharacterized protein n=1 Tax=Portunus trituberculatus TaxID=210409 RepID=A0A5B7J3T4_PORTR|nr:hypothetical protein [Portunus trituberculatus]